MSQETIGIASGIALTPFAAYGGYAIAQAYSSTEYVTNKKMIQIKNLESNVEKSERKLIEDLGKLESKESIEDGYLSKYLTDYNTSLERFNENLDKLDKKLGGSSYLQKYKNLVNKYSDIRYYQAVQKQGIKVKDGDIINDSENKIQKYIRDYKNMKNEMNLMDVNNDKIRNLSNPQKFRDTEHKITELDFKKNIGQRTMTELENLKSTIGRISNRI